MTPSATARAAATTTRSLMQVSSSRRRPVARWSVRRLVYTSWPRADIGTPDQPCQPRLFAGPLEPSALGRAKLGHDAVAVAAVDRVDELDRPVALVSARALEEERRRVKGDAERRRFLLVRHRRLDRLRSVDDVDLVPIPEQVVERAGEILRRQSGHEALRKVKRLDRHRLPVGHAKALDHEDRLGRRHLQEPAETGAGEYRRHREGAAAGLHPTPAHVVAEGGDGQLLGDLRMLDVCPAAAPADEVALAREVVERGANGEPRDAEIGAQLALGGDRRPDAELLDEVEDLPARVALLGHLRHAHGPAHYRPVPQNWSMPLRLPRGTGID